MAETQAVTPILIIVLTTLGTAILFMSYLVIQKLTDGHLKRYAKLIWMALLVFSIAGAFRSANELELLNNPIFTNIEYAFYCIYYLFLLYAVFKLYKMSKLFTFRDRTAMMAEALHAKRNDNGLAAHFKLDDPKDSRNTPTEKETNE
ncbi:MAG: hypothetical protein JXA98_03385 [Methanosarcinaceae archaeon]|nr:hypothetical protein [Methanosarcinaceae archaeon]